MARARKPRQVQQPLHSPITGPLRYSLLALAAAALPALWTVCSFSHIGSEHTGPHQAASSLSRQQPPLQQRTRGDILGAVTNGNAIAVAALLDDGASVHATTADGWTALHLAVQHGHAETVGVLLERGARVDATAQGGWTPLHLAAGVGHAVLVSPLVEHGASLSIVNADGFTSLHLGAQFGHQPVIRALAESGASLDATTPDGATPLHLAAERGHAAVANQLLMHGAAADSTGITGWTPLHVALEKGHASTAMALLENGAKAGLARIDGTAPLHLAARYTTPQLVRALLERGAHVNALGPNGVTALHESVWNTQDQRLLMASVLLDHGAYTNAATADYGLTALHMVASSGDAATAQLLLERGASADSLTRFNHTALRMASYYGHAQLGELLRAELLRAQPHASAAHVDEDVRRHDDESRLAPRSSPGRCSSLDELVVDASALEAPERALDVWRRCGARLCAKCAPRLS